jgi:hypothetical protein
MFLKNVSYSELTSFSDISLFIAGAYFFFTPNLRNNFNIIFEATKIAGKFLLYASERLKNNLTIVK